MIRVVPLIQTAASEKFKEFLTRPFNFEMLYSPSGISALFYGWKGKNMGNWQKYVNDEKDSLEVYADTYNICHKTKVFTLPHPKTILDFIHDMNRVDIQIYWNEWIETDFLPPDYISKDNIKNYYFTLLNKIGKSEELQ